VEGSESETIAGTVLARADDDSLGLLARDLRLTHAEVVSGRRRGLPGSGPPGP
jgi:hypothetical protein